MDSGKDIVVYTIDSENKIIHFDEGWKEAAVLGGASLLLEESKFMNQLIEHYIHDVETQAYYASIFKRCREKQEIMEHNYRCDSPTHQRFMKVTLTPFDNGNITLTHETLSEVPFRHEVHLQNIVAFSPDDAIDAKRCSICNRLKLANNSFWTKPERLADDDTVNLKVVHTICSSCRKHIEAKLQSDKEGLVVEDLKKTIFAYMIPIGIVLSILLGLFFIIISKERDWQINKYKEEAEISVNNINSHIQEELSAVTSHLLLFSENNELQYLQNNHQEKSYTEKKLLNFMEYNPLYDQLRFIDLHGMEKFRINNHADYPRIVPTEELQSKVDSYYFQDVMKLSPKEVYISKVDLNVEHGKIEVPHKPILRVAKKVYNDKGEAEGILVLNILFEKMMQIILHFNHANFPSAYIANGNGNWLVAEGEETYTFMFGDESNQVMKYSQSLWKSMQSSSSGTLIENGSLLSYKNVNALGMLQQIQLKYNIEPSEIVLKGMNNESLQWWIIQKIPESLVKEKMWENIFKGLPYLIFGMAVVIVLSVYLISFYRRIKNANLQFRLIENSFENADEGMIITDNQTRILRVNAKYEAITGYTSEELLGSTPQKFSSGWTDNSVYKKMWEGILEEQYWEGEIVGRRKDGTVYDQWLRIIVLKDDGTKTVNYLGIATDISERKKNQDRIYKLAYEDPLTGLPNRKLFLDRMQHAIAKAKRDKQRVSLMFIDLDDFKLINDTAGHMAGDQVLREVSNRVQYLIREGDTLSRIGGDEFVILLEQVDTMDVINIAQKVLDSLSESLIIEENKYFISASMGIAFFPDDALDGESLFKHADTAMYKAKEQGKNNYCFFTSEMNKEVNGRVTMTRHLKEATKTGAFSLVYQPQISLETNRVIGAEALIRWNDPELGFISPATFIPLAESTSLIIPITMWVIENSCKAIETLCKECDSKLNIAINISSIHLKEKDFVEQIHETILKAGVSPEQIELEITEGALIDNVEDTVEKLQTLKKYGYKIAIDDFGTGYSSLSYLKLFGFEKLKIDQAFVKGLPANQEDVSLTKSIIAIGKALGMRLIAEGAETQENVEFLKANGCDMIQGYYYSKPLPIDEFIIFTNEFNKS
jgi:diguanylate cyclase (GGDEF)-like protein/PAS domain S-box-containing protein